MLLGQSQRGRLLGVGTEAVEIVVEGAAEPVDAGEGYRVVGLGAGL